MCFLKYYNRNNEMKPMRKYNIVKLFLIVAFGLQSSLMYTSGQISNPWGTELHKAVFDNKLGEVQRLVANGANINARDADGYTSLHRAVYHNFEEIVQFLIASGANLHIKDMSGSTPLLQAVAYDNVRMAQILIQAGSSLSSISKMGLTPLALAVLDDRVEMVQMLIDAGALGVQDIHAPGFKKNIKSPAMKAIFEQVELKKQLAEQSKMDTSDHQVNKDVVNN
jgi:ankyrin repeat protein